MTYLTINEKTAVGRRLLDELRKHKAEVKILETPNDETKKALRDAKSGRGVKKIKDFSKWLDKVWAE